MLLNVPQNDCHNETIVNFMTPPRKQLLLPSDLRVLGSSSTGVRVVQCLLSRKQLQVFWKRRHRAAGHGNCKHREGIVSGRSGLVLFPFSEAIEILVRAQQNVVATNGRAAIEKTAVGELVGCK